MTNTPDVAAAATTETNGSLPPSSRTETARTLLASSDRKKRLSRKPDIVERRRFYEDLRDDNQKIVREQRDLTYPYPDGQLPPWEAYLLTDGDDEGADAGTLQAIPPTAAGLASAHLSPSIALGAAPPATSAAGFSTFMLDLAEESMQKQPQFEMTAEKTFLEIPIQQYNRQLHFERGLEAVSRWLRPLNKLAKKAYFDVKSKVAKGHESVGRLLGRQWSGLLRGSPRAACSRGGRAASSRCRAARTPP
jgi:hypothetical protein